MTAAELLQHYRQSKPLHRHVPFTCFVHENVFLTRKGAYGAVFQLTGIDDECLTEQRLEAVSTALITAFRLLDEHFRVYQYFLKTRQGELPRNDTYASNAVHRIVEDRAALLRDKGGLRKIEIYLVVLFDPDESKRIGRKARKETAASRPNSVNSLLAKANSLRISLSDLFAPRLLDQQAAFRFFRLLLNLDEQVANRLPLKSPALLDYHAVASRLNWDKEGRLSCGGRQMKILSLKELPSSTVPNLFRDLAGISTDMILWSEFRRAPNPDVRKTVAEQRKFLWNLKRLSFGQILSRAARNDQSETDADLEDNSARILIRDLQQALVTMETDGGYFGKFSFGVVLHGSDERQLEAAASEVHRVLTDYEAETIEETYGALSAYFAMLPGNAHYNVRRLWLQNNHYADLSFVYTPHTGNLRAKEVNDEYLAAFETRQGTAFFFDPYYNGSFGISIFGPRGSGKSVLGNFLTCHAQKYDGYTFVFDIGGSFEENAKYFGGSILKVTLARQSFAINPFSLEDTPDNQQFLFNFLKLLMGSEELSREDSQQLADAIAGMYGMYSGTELMRLGTLASLLPSHLRHRLTKWVSGGQYAALFDHAADTLQLSRFVVFDMQGVEEHEAIVQPLLYYLFFRIKSIVHDPALTGVFKALAIDELWKYLKNDQVAAFVNDVIKTGRKHLVGVILMTQSAGDLGPQTELIRDNCKMTMFLANANAERQQYAEQFGLNDRELDLLTTLRPREILLKTPEYSKVLRLDIDQKSYWRFTTSPLERMKRREAIERYGDAAINHLASTPISGETR